MTLWPRGLARSRDTLPTATKLCKVVTYFGRLLPLKSHDPLMTCLARSRDKLKLLHLHYHSAYGHQTWHGGKLPCEALHGSRVTLSCEITWQIKNIKSALPQYFWLPNWQGGNLPWEAPIHNVTWSFDVMWQVKLGKSTPALDKWIPNMVRWQLTLGCFYP